MRRIALLLLIISMCFACGDNSSSTASPSTDTTVPPADTAPGDTAVSSTDTDPGDSHSPSTLCVTREAVVPTTDFFVDISAESGIQVGNYEI